MGRILGRQERAKSDAVPAEELPEFPEDSDAKTQNIAVVRDAPEDGATQNIAAVGGDAGENSTQNLGAVDDAFGSLYRDSSASSGAPSHTAEIDLSAMSDFDDEPPHRHGRRRSASGGRTALIVGGFAVVLVAGATGAFFLARGAGGTDAETAAAADPPGSPSTLESGTLFPETLDVNGTEYELALVDATDDCSTVGRNDYGSVLADNGCEQVIRATYTDPEGGLAVTAGIAAMGSADEAGAAIEAQDLNQGDWFAGLKGSDGSGAENMEAAAGRAGGGQWGPYLVFSLAANADGAPPAEDDAALEKAGDGFVDTVLASLVAEEGG
ncbi:hypothetical protein GCM10027440_48340 [Nocardiopsis coralliicola]